MAVLLGTRPRTSELPEKFHGSDTELAAVVDVMANVIQVLHVEDMAEEFTIVFTLTFEWVDPQLSDFKSMVAYRLQEAESSAKPGSFVKKRVWRRPCTIVSSIYGSCVILQIDPQADFAVGDIVESTSKISYKKTKTSEGLDVPRGYKACVTSVHGEDKTLVVTWFSEDTGTLCSEKQVSWKRVKLVPGSGVEMSPSMQHFNIKVPWGDFLGSIEPDWRNDPLLFLPKWSFENQVGEMTTLLHERSLQYVAETGGHVREKYKFQGTFRQEMDLRRFPFDQHILSIRITAEQHFKRQQWKPVRDTAGKVGITPTEWLAAGTPKLVKYALREGQFLERCRIQTSLKRQPSFFLKHVVVLTFMLGLSSATVVLLEPSKIGERSAVLLTVLLVMAAYKHMTSQWIPRKPYYTWMDYYVTMGFIMQLMLLLESIFIVKMLCHNMDDQDGKLDGFYNVTSSPYKYRPPPDFECADEASGFDWWFMHGIYSAWILLHVPALIPCGQFFSISSCGACSCS